MVSGFTVGLIDWQAETTTLLNIFEPLWKESYEQGARGVSAQLYGLASIQRPERISTAKLRVGSRVVGITQTTKDAISRIVSAALEHGDGRESITKLDSAGDADLDLPRPDYCKPRVQHQPAHGPVRYDAYRRGRIQNVARHKPRRRPSVSQSYQRPDRPHRCQVFKRPDAAMRPEL